MRHSSWWLGGVLFLAGACALADESSLPVTNDGSAIPEFLPAVSEREKRILAELEKPTSVDFVKTPLKEVVDFFRAKHQIDIVIDDKALAEAGVGVDTPITRRLQNVSVRSAWNLLCRDLDLAYFVDDDVLQLTTKDVADGNLITRVYPVADLVTDEFYDSLVELLTTTVRPTVWGEGNGYRWECQGFQGSLVIIQSHQVHDEIRALLRSLRDAKKFAATMPAK